MDRDQLAEILGHAGEALVACRQAVLAGAQFRIYDGTVPASILVSIYARRERHTRKHAIPTLGFVGAVGALAGRGDEPVRIGAVDITDPPYHFQLFLNDTATAVIACLGADQDRSRRQDIPPGELGDRR